MALHCGTHGTCQGCPSVSRDSGMGRTVGLWPSTVGHMGPVKDVLVCPGTLGWEGQWDCGPPLWDTWDLSGMSQGSRDSGTSRTVGFWTSTVGHMGSVRDVPGVPGLWDGKDSGIVALHCGTHGICPGCPRGPGTLGWEGQWDCSPPLWDTWDMSRGSRESETGRTVCVGLYTA